MYCDNNSNVVHLTTSGQEKDVLIAALKLTEDILST